MDTGNKIIIILLILIAIAALVCGFLFISNGLGNSEDTELQENVTNVTNTTINETENLTVDDGTDTSVSTSSSSSGSTVRYTFCKSKSFWKF